MRSRHLVEFAPQVVFRHPVVRFCVYHSTRSHNNLGFIGRWRLRMTRASIPDRVAWQSWMAVRGPDDAVASITAFAAVLLAVPYRAHSAFWLGTWRLPASSPLVICCRRISAGGA